MLEAMARVEGSKKNVIQLRREKTQKFSLKQKSFEMFLPAPSVKLRRPSLTSEHQQEHKLKVEQISADPKGSSSE